MVIPCLEDATASSGNRNEHRIIKDIIKTGKQELLDHIEFSTYASLLLKFIYKDSSFLFTGDIANNDVSESFNFATEDWLVEKYGDELKADVLKIAHHGNGDTMSSMEYRAAISPKITVTISTFPRDLGEHNKNITAGAVALNTALDGDILVCTDGDGKYTVGVCHGRTAAEYETLDTEKGFMTID